ncbi:septum formation family protein [Antribacter gilvus]|uniref:septum formation family protein n=1 Tax=Antribacter gilvus TaxID=2304675 RepID=UPI000F793E6D|nr:septum formation family protein [Antribacter gilvus]
MVSAPRRTTRRTLIAVSAAALSAALLTGCGAILDEIGGPQEAPRDEPGGEITASAEADIFSIKLGDCLDMAAFSSVATEFETAPVIPCTDPHTGEIFAELTLPEGDFPGDDALATQAEEYCVAEFGTFVGLSYEESALDFTYFVPTSDGWTQADDRVMQCVIESTEPVTGTMAGIAQ